MPSTMMGTRELFEDPDFGLQLTEWQRSSINLAAMQSAFCDGVDNVLVVQIESVDNRKTRGSIFANLQ